MLDKAKNVFFSPAARGLLISFTTYCVRNDWWAYTYIFHEYGAHDELINVQVRSHPFKPHLYEN